MRGGPFAFLLLLSACAAARPNPFVELGPLSARQVVEILAARTAARTLSAELTIVYESRELEGSFDAVAHFRRPGSMRVTAFKDLVLALEPIFDLTITPEAYALELRGEDGKPPLAEHGAFGELASRQPRFAGFAWGREAFCLPGALEPDRSIVVREIGAGELAVEGFLSSGAAVRWTVKRATLEVESGVVTAPDGAVGTFHYSDYFSERGVFVPGRIVFEDAAGGSRIEARVGELRVDPQLDPSLFEPATMIRSPEALDAGIGAHDR